MESGQSDSLQVQKVLVTDAFEPDHFQLLRDRYPQIQFVPIPKDGTVPPAGRDAEVILRCAMLKHELSHALQGAPLVKWIHTSTAGFDWVMVPEVEERQIEITRSPASKAKPIAEYVLAYIFLMAKRLPALLRAQTAHRWTPSNPDEVGGKTIGVIGAGAIGREVARLGSAFGMRVIGMKRTPEPLANFDRVLGAKGLPIILNEADYVVLSCPLTPETENMIRSSQLQQMKSSAYLINIARGGLIVEQDLLQALQENWIAGACLDVFNEEPLPPESPFWDMENVVITPHTTWGSPHSLDYVLDEFILNLDRHLAGNSLLNKPKNLVLGY
jgi:phosphoglycerate dehydrogenase-like enzyme